MAAPKKVDYERIEPGWRAGIKSPPQLAAEYTADTGVSVSHAAIIKHFKKLGVPRDLSAKVRAKADSMVMESMVTGKVSSVTIPATAKTIEVAATELATVRISHRVDIRAGRDLVGKLLAELKGVTDEPELIEALQQALLQADSEGGDSIDIQAARGRAQRLRDALDRVVSIGGRVAAVKGLAEAMKTLIGLERQAWNMDDPEPGDAVPPLTDAERASRLATLLARAQAAADAANG
jgi:hypothetical protein